LFPCLSLFHLLKRARVDETEGMGNAKLVNINVQCDGHILIWLQFLGMETSLK
jgi:hypothetical protein